ncbi:MAG TPA: hypothetical protein VFR40_09800 [Lapillicoccus sp.]|nr:hypothetical protein [Lapillicoccus sp.]
MHKLLTAVVLSALGVCAITFAAVITSTAVEADTAFLSTISAGAVVIGLLAIVVALLERTNNRPTGPTAGPLGADRHDDRDTVRVRDELRAIGFGGLTRP